MNTHTLAKTTLGLIACLMLTAGDGAGQATTDTWSGATSSAWTNGANWSLGTAATSTNTARFGYSAQSTVNLDAGLTEVQKMYWYFSSTKTSYNITGAGSASTTLKINPNTNAGWNMIDNLAVTGGANQTFSNLTLLLEDSNTTGQLKITPGVGGITIASNAILQLGSTTAQSVIVEANNSQTGSGTLSINGALTAGVTGSSLVVDKSGVLNLNLAAGSDFTNLQLRAVGGGIINFYTGGNLGGSVTAETGGSVVNFAASGITLGTTAFSMANGGILRTSYGSGTSTLGGQVTIATGTNGPTSTFDIATGGTLALTNRLQGTSASSIVEKTGGGTLALSYSVGSGNSITSSAFNVRAGTLLVNNTGNTTATGTAPVNIYSGATLAGSGKITGAVTINSGGTIDPGNSPGTLTVGSLIWNDGGNYNWQLFDATGAAGTGYDTISSAGGLNLSSLNTGGFNINLWTLSSSNASSGSAINFNSNGSNSWILGTFSGGITGFNASKFTINTAATNGTTGFANSFTAGGFNISTNGSGQLLLTYQGAAPASPVWTGTSGNLSTIGTTNGSALVFTGAAGGNVTNNQVTSLSSMTFSNGAGAYNFSQNALTNGSGGIVNNSTASQTVSLPLTLSANQSFDAASGNLAISGNVTNNGNTLTLAGASNTTVSGIISGTGGLTKTNAGTATLSGINTFTGKTTVSAGTLILAAGASLASTEINLGTSGQGTLTATGGITIRSGQTLAGYGTLVGNTTIASGGALAPGNSPGILDITGNLTLNSGSTSIFEVVSTSAAGVGFDQVNATGALAYGGVLQLNISGLFGENSAFAKNLFTFGSEAGNFSNVQYSFNNGSSWNNLTYYSAINTWQMWDNTALANGADNGYVGINLTSGVLTVVPEPSTWALVVGGVSTMVILRRRKQS